MAHQTTQQALPNAGDTLTVLRGGIIEVTQANQAAVTAPNGATITNHGTLRRSGTCCPAVDLGHNNTLTNTGTIVGANGATTAVYVYGSGNTVINSGSIIAADSTTSAINFSQIANGTNPAAQNNTLSLLDGSRIFGTISLSSVSSDTINLSGLGTEGVDLTITSAGGQPIVNAPSGRQVAITAQGGGVYRIVVDPVVSLSGMTKFGFDAIAHVNNLNENWTQDEGRLRYNRNNSIWARSFGSTNRRDDSDAVFYGLASGADVRVSRDFTTSGYIGYVGAESHDAGDRELSTYFGGLAGRFDNKRVHASVSFNYGELSAEGSDAGFGRGIVQSNTLSSGFRTNAVGGGESKEDLDGHFYSATAHVGLRIAKFGRVHFNPFASVSYTKFEHDGIDGDYVSLSSQIHSAVISRIGLTAMTSFRGMILSATGGREFRHYGLIDGTQSSLNFGSSTPVELQDEEMWIFGASLTHKLREDLYWKLKFEGHRGDELAAEKVEVSARYQF